jgi:hypothetical protein
MRSGVVRLTISLLQAHPATHPGYEKALRDMVEEKSN